MKGIPATQPLKLVLQVTGLPRLSTRNWVKSEGGTETFEWPVRRKFWLCTEAEI